MKYFLNRFCRILFYSRKKTKTNITLLHSLLSINFEALTMVRMVLIFCSVSLCYVNNYSMQERDWYINMEAQKRCSKLETVWQSISCPKPRQSNPNTSFCRECNSASNGMTFDFFWKNSCSIKAKYDFLKFEYPVSNAKNYLTNLSIPNIVPFITICFLFILL